MSSDYRRPGFHSLVPGFSATGSAALLDFFTRAFDAREGEIGRNADGSIGHGEIYIGDSLIELSEARPAWPSRPCAIHYYVPDTDAVYERALAAGAVSMTAPSDAPYGDRTANVRDPGGNYWFIATRLEGPPVPKGFRALTPYVITSSASKVIEFMQQTFGSIERVRYPRKEGEKEGGGIMHSEHQLDDSTIEIADGCPEWPAMPCHLHVYVPDVDAAYRRALVAGARSIYEPTLQPYGDRECGVLDAGGNYWFIATNANQEESPGESPQGNGQLRGTLTT